MTSNTPRRPRPPGLPLTDKLSSDEYPYPAMQQDQKGKPPEQTRPNRPGTSDTDRETGSRRAIYYTPLPNTLAEVRDRHHLPFPIWRIELHGLLAGAPLGFDILGDVVIGRSAPGMTPPDIDLAAFKGRLRAVSRRHALLRPTAQSLYLLDLGSTNGTGLNMAPLAPGRAAALSKINTITLGVLTFTLKIISGPT